MTPDREKLRQLAERADKAGWTLDTDGDLCARVPTCWREDAWQDEQGRANAAFVVAAQPAAVLSLLDEIKQLADDLREYKEAHEFLETQNTKLKADLAEAREALRQVDAAICDKSYFAALQTTRSALAIKGGGEQ